jgi:hypothetical protein
MERHGRRARGSKIQRAEGGKERELERYLRSGETREKRTVRQNEEGHCFRSRSAGS